MANKETNKFKCEKCGSGSYQTVYLKGEKPFTTCLECKKMGIAGVDLTKISSQEVEGRIAASTADEARIKRAAFGRWADEISVDIKNAPDQKEYNRLTTLRDNTVHRIYNKYK